MTIDTDIVLPTGLGSLKPFIKLFTHFSESKPLIEYATKLYMAQKLIEIVANYLEKSENPHKLNVLEVKNLEHSIETLLFQVSQEKEALVNSNETVSLRKDINDDDGGCGDDYLNSELNKLDIGEVEDSLGKFEKELKSSLREFDVLNEEGKLAENDELANDLVKNIQHEEPSDDDVSTTASNVSSLESRAEPVQFTMSQVIDSPMVFRNYLLIEANTILENSMLSIELSKISKSEAVEFVMAARILEIVLYLYPQESVSASKETKAKQRKVSISLDNVETIVQSDSSYSSKSLLTNAEIKRKLKYTKLAGARVLKKIKNNEKLSYVKDKELQFFLSKISHVDKDELSEILNAEDEASGSGEDDILSKLPSVSNDAPKSESLKSSGSKSPAKHTSESEQAHIVTPVTHTQETRTVEEIIEDTQFMDMAIKNCKYAINSMEYEDDKAALEFLEKAVELVKQHQQHKSKE